MGLVRSWISIQRYTANTFQCFREHFWCTILTWKLFYNGMGTILDEKQALDWYTKAVKNGNVIAKEY